MWLQPPVGKSVYSKLWLRQSHLIDPQFAHDDVVHRGGDLLPCVVIVSLLEDRVNCAYDEGGNMNKMRQVVTIIDWPQREMFESHPYLKA